MATKYLIIPLIITPLIDIIYEFFYQINFIRNLHHEISKFEAVVQWIKKSHSHHIHHLIIHCSEHAIKHLIVHMHLIQMSILYIFLSLSERLCSLFSEIFKKLIFYHREFIGVSSFEMTILQLQCAIIRYWECMHAFQHFAGHSALSHILWLLIAFILISPIEMRCKIYLEKKLHYFAPLFCAAVYSIFVYLYPALILVLESQITKEVLISEQSSKILSEFCQEKSMNIHLYLKPDESESLFYEIVNTPFYKAIKLCGNTDLFNNEDNEALIMHACQSFTLLGVSRMIIVPTILNFLFAFTVIAVDMIFLKSFCNSYIHHITGHFILEEFLNLGWQRILLFPLNLLNHNFDNKMDNIVKESGYGSNLANVLMVSEPNLHKNLNPSPFYRIFNNEANVFERVELLSSKNK